MTPFAQNSRDEVRVQGDGTVCEALTAMRATKQQTYIAVQDEPGRREPVTTSDGADVFPSLCATDGSKLFIDNQSVDGGRLLLDGCGGVPDPVGRAEQARVRD